MVVTSDHYKYSARKSNIKVHMAKLKYKKQTATSRRAASVEWYKEIVGTKNPSASNMLVYQQETGLKGKIGVGYLQHMTYLAKHRKTLPYWDAFPLSLTIDVGTNYLLDCNLHYLSPTWREKVLKALYENMTGDKPSSTKAKINYAMIKEMTKYGVFKPTIKKHLFSQIKSKPILIPPSDWEKVIFLPSEDFIGASNMKVWRDSAKIIKGKK